MKSTPITAAAVTLAISALLATPGGALAQTKKSEKSEKHESNTLKKTVTKVRKALRPAGRAVEKGANRAGKTIVANTSKGYKATEYGVRKGGENVSVETHRAIGRNSVRINRGPKKDEVITPKGKHIPIKRTK